MRTRIIAMLSILSMFFACAEAEQETATAITFMVTDTDATRSSYPQETETSVKSVLFAVYDKDGRLEYSVKGNPSFCYEFRKGEDYDILALVNTDPGIDQMPASIESAMSMDELLETDRLTPEKVAEKGLPMSGSLHFNEASVRGSSMLGIPVSRKFARLEVTVDFSSFHENLKDIDRLDCDHNLRDIIRDIRIGAGGVNRRISLFSESRARATSDIAASFTDTDSGTISGKKLSLVLYVPENMQGDLLRGNDDPARKNADVLGKVSALCTYLEVDFSMAKRIMGIGGTLKYRFYPGSDHVSNFDVKGGRSYSMTLVPSFDNALNLSACWKLDNTGWSDDRSVSFSQEYYFIPKGKVFNISSVLAFDGASMGSAFLGKDIYYSIRPASGGEWHDIVHGIPAGSSVFSGVTYQGYSARDKNGTEGLGLKFTSDIGSKYEMRISTTDGRHSDICSIMVIPGEELPVSWTSKPEYVAMRGILRVSGLASSINEKFDSFTVISGEGLIRKSVSGTAMTVSAISPGAIQIEARTKIDGRICRSRIITLSISSPTLRIPGGTLTLNPDGTPKDLGIYYVLASGNQYDTYDRNLYEELLSPVVTITGPWLGTDGKKTVHIAHINDSGTAMDIENTGKSIGNVMVTPKTAVPGISPISKAVYPQDIFKDIRGERNYGVYHDRTMVLPSRYIPYLDSPLVSTYSFPGRFLFNADPAMLSFSGTCDFGGKNKTMEISGNYSILPSGDRAITGIQFRFLDQNVMGHLAGSHTLYATLTRENGERITEKMGTFEVYTHFAIGGRLERDSHGKLMARVAVSNFEKMMEASRQFINFDEIYLKFNYNMSLNDGPQSPVSGSGIFVRSGVFGIEDYFYSPPSNISNAYSTRTTYKCPILLCDKKGENVYPYGSYLSYVYPQNNVDSEENGYYCLGYLSDYASCTKGWVDYFENNNVH